MLLCIDIGNTNIVLGLHDGAEWSARWRVRTARDNMPDEYEVLIRSLFSQRSLSIDAVERVVISSVVPRLKGVFREMFDDGLGITTIVLGPGAKTGVKIRTDNPVEVGADLIADAAAAHELYGGPAVVVDFGTATTFSAISAAGEFLGVAIAPGVDVAAEALTRNTAQLPQVGLTAPEKAIGTNTVHALQSGLIFGYVGLVEGLVARIRAELGGAATVIATGGFSRVMAPLTSAIDHVDPDLTLEGLRVIAARNR